MRLRIKSLLRAIVFLSNKFLGDENICQSQHMFYPSPGKSPGWGFSQVQILPQLGKAFLAVFHSQVVDLLELPRVSFRAVDLDGL